MEISLETIGGGRPWIARVVGVGGKYGLIREFENGTVDYSGSNSKRTRGVFTSWILSDGIYEVKGGHSWGSAGDRKFIRVKGETQEDIKGSEVRKLLAPAPAPVRLIETDADPVFC